MPCPRNFLAVMLCTGFAAAAYAQSVDLREHVQVQGHLHLIEHPDPDFPKSELMRGREGWALVVYDVLDDGSVSSPVIEASSGSDAFNKATLEAVSKWRYLPGEPQSEKVLVHFIYERKQSYVSKRFFVRDRKVHAAIDKGRLDEAQERIDNMRARDDLTAVELAYTYVAEGRIHEVRGDKAGQLENFRKAMISDGRWLNRNDYLKLLHATVILELQVKDYSSALRDYALLTETDVGRKLAADIEGPMQQLRGFVGDGAGLPPPYAPAELEVIIVHEPPQPSRRDQLPTPEPEEPTRPERPPPSEPPPSQSS